MKITEDKKFFSRSKLVLSLHDALSKDRNAKGNFKLPEDPGINSIAEININNLMQA